ncbi:MAG: HD domain-containing protein [Gammaproteobacteria bacterium]|nr:HD domain-containing protein [Gammaproteobacteria bacterium]MBU1775599.1 HD domain-containing protein [Gammaproteobacteria bacterium]MBU1967731.1 HD domain-containing protein [Gammaproteobacteria bacterium]
MSTYNVNLHEAIYSLSDALDLVGVTHIHHGKRVAYMATECGKHLGWDGARLDDLFQAAILHDSGVSRTMVHANLAQMAWENEAEHCHLGAELLAGSPLLQHLSDTILHHHTHWSVLEGLDLPLEVKLRANCIYLTDRVDVMSLGWMAGKQDILLGKEEIRRKIHERRGDWFHPQLVDAFMDISRSEAFWFTLESDNVNAYLATWLSHFPDQTMEFDELRSLVHIFSRIVDAKSPYTRQHSDGVANLARYLGSLFKLPQQTCELLELVGLLHDIGKLRVPDELLDKPSELDEAEVYIMRRHSFDTYNILRNIRGLESVSLWALQHHERMDGTGYPNHTKGTELSFEARIVAVADVFQALAQDRPYRGALEQQVIMTLLKVEAEAGKLDAEVVAVVEANLQECWRVAVDPV